MVLLFVYTDQKKLRIWTLFMRCLQPETTITNYDLIFVSNKKTHLGWNIMKSSEEKYSFRPCYSSNCSNGGIIIRMPDADFTWYLKVMEYETVKTDCKQQNNKWTAAFQFNAESPFQINPFIKYFAWSSYLPQIDHLWLLVKQSDY